MQLCVLQEEPTLGAGHSLSPAGPSSSPGPGWAGVSEEPRAGSGERGGIRLRLAAVTQVVNGGAEWSSAARRLAAEGGVEGSGAAGRGAAEGAVDRALPGRRRWARREAGASEGRSRG